ncbi:MAG: PspC domain-containing protein, partial [Bacteroidota bacterium]
MKKTISINIAGILFHIEEEGYEKLRSYLDGVAAYFARFEGSKEIVSDIEARIAEILIARQSEQGKVITPEELEHVINTMGKVSDFAAGEAEGAEAETAPSSEQPQPAGGPAKKLFRDGRRKVFGGVCAGLSHLLKFDPVWLRVAFALLIPATSGGIIIAYLILWAVVPVSNELEDQESVRKMYRDPESKVLGGVAAGISSYTGWDLSVIRVLWVAAAFLGGFGVILYIILWIALPEANSLTEKMRMQGQPVTLSNIEKTVKDRLQDKPGEESTLAKIILFPFRAIAAILNALGKALGPIVTALVKGIRVLAGLIITLVGVVVAIAFLITTAILMGFLSVPDASGDWAQLSNGFPLESLQNSFSVWTILFLGIALFIPFLYIALLGISLIANRLVIGRIAGWSMAIVFLISAIWLAIRVPSTLMDFQRDGSYRTEQTFNITKGIPVLRVQETSHDNYNYQVVDVRLRGHGQNNILAVSKFEAQGRTKKQAIENAKTVDYAITQSDSVLAFDSNITFKDNAPFRAQRLRVDVFLPFGTTFAMTKGFHELMDNHRHDLFDEEDDDDAMYRFRMDSTGLKCLSCPADREDEESYGGTVYDGERTVRDDFGYEDFDAIDLSGVYHAEIRKGDKFAVELKGSEEARELADIHQEGGTLVIKHRKNMNFIKGWANDLALEVVIIMPDLEKLESTGAGEVEIRGFDADKMEIDLTGAVKVEANFD